MVRGYPLTRGILQQQRRHQPARLLGSVHDHQPGAVQLGSALQHREGQRSGADDGTGKLQNLQEEEEENNVRVWWGRVAYSASNGISSVTVTLQLQLQLQLHY
jgi:hypothetical protein